MTVDYCEMPCEKSLRVFYLRKNFSITNSPTFFAFLFFAFFFRFFFVCRRQYLISFTSVCVYIYICVCEKVLGIFFTRENARKLLRERYLCSFFVFLSLPFHFFVSLRFHDTRESTLRGTNRRLCVFCTDKLR